MLEKFHKALFESDNGFMDTRGHPMNHMTKNCDTYKRDNAKQKVFTGDTFYDKKNDYATTFYHKQLFKKRKNITLLMIYGEVD